ncbi:hypothetical protein LR948_16455 [Roseivivax sp. GX 12232]|uniref:alginate O-acetyltransferase AlgX-related protein n=1 Tax=Roseivivax sp. GX 12232 TaxID=2900547 RepID=UPI001E2E7308|nr:hypothetical protein [Roseivivax sp. GX 12232]MCE0506963.1 hypothetical protein [Roseivivax sp. GX 12232]
MTKAAPKLCAALLALTSPLSAPPLAAAPEGGEGPAPSRYGCHGLQSAKPMRLMEGSEGTFYRVTLDMRTNHPLSVEAAGLMGRLAEALRAQGTELIYVPVPTKSLAMPDNLPEAAAGYGFDIGIAETAYDAFLGKLREAGVTTVDSMRAMRGAEGAPFIGTDFHWSPEGARAVAEALGSRIRELPGYGEMPKTDFETTASEPRMVNSALRRQIQAHCRETVPRAEVRGFETEAAGGADTSGGIFAEEGSGPPIALAGTSMSAEPRFHFEGFLSQAAGAAVANYSVTGGNQFGGITGYLLSEDFRDNPPEVLVWENPIYNNLGDFGEFPFRELLGAVATSCAPLETEVTEDGGLRAALPEEGLNRDSYVEVDTGAADGRAARLTFVTDAGLEARAEVTRPDRYAPTQRFYHHVAPLWRDDFTALRVTLDQPAREGASLSICHEKETST